MGRAEFCVVCGRTDRSLTDGVCPDCAAGRAVLVAFEPGALVVVCPTCGARKGSAGWAAGGSPSRLTADDLLPHVTVHPEAAVRRIAWTEIDRTGGVADYRASATVRFRGTERTVDFPARVRIERRVCPTCSRRSGRFYTAIVQLRAIEDEGRERPAARRERLQSAWALLLRDGRREWTEAVAWNEARPEGWDYYLSDTLVARALARAAKQRFGATLKESASLVGRRDGAEVYRVTFCVRIPRPRPPDPRSDGAAGE